MKNGGDLLNSIFNTREFDTAVSIVSTNIKKILLNIPPDIKSETAEIRLRSQRPIVLCGSYGFLFVTYDANVSKCNEDSISVTYDELNDTFNRLCSFSVHTHLPSIINGYITMQGGHRVGIAGTAVTDSMGNIVSIKDVNSINIRVAREIKGAADEIIDKLYSNSFESTILAGTVSCGKTTLIRDLARQLASFGESMNYKVCVIDERQEIACVSNGIPQNDLGVNCDILSCYPKGQAIISAVKTLSPDIIVLDEVGTTEEIEAIKLGVNSGVKFIVTVHAEDYDEIINKPQIRELINTYSFKKLVLMNRFSKASYINEIYDVKDLRDEIIRCRFNLDKSYSDRRYDINTA